MSKNRGERSQAPKSHLTTTPNARNANPNSPNGSKTTDTQSTSPPPSQSEDSASRVAAIGPAQILEILGKITDKLDAHDRVIKQLAQEAANRSVFPAQGMPPTMQMVPGTQMVAPAGGPQEPPAWIGPIIQAFLPKILGTQTSEMDKLASEVTRIATMKQAFDSLTPRSLSDRLGERLVLQVLARIPGLATLTDKAEIAKQLGELSSEAAGH